MNIDYKLIGSRIKCERNRCGLTQEVLAEKLDVSVGYVSQVERGFTKISLDLLGKISSILDCDVKDLIAESATGSARYMNANLESRFARLTEKEKRLISEIIDSVIANR